jgi:uncharacterized protein YjbJ (UPF0337 family)
MDNENNKNNGLWNQIEGKWHQFSGDVRARWGDLTDDDLAEINGNREKLQGKIQERYGIAQQEAQKQIDEWQKKVNDR